jgi:hypothetical protein
MKHLPLKALGLLVLVCGLLALSGCQNPDAPNVATTTSTSSPQNVGEQPAPPSPSSSEQAPAGVQATPARALEAFAWLYVNWTFRTLVSDQRRLAAMSVGSARLAERQAAAASQADTTITRGQIYNTGQVVSVAPELSNTETWIIVTRERTAGGASNTEYDGLQATYHVTLAELARVPGGYAVETWLPQT